MLEFLNRYLCGIIVPIFLVILGLYFAFKLKFFYVFHPIKTVKCMLSGGFKSLSIALAGTLGVGNIIGVASAILSGGAGAIFWMWISALIAMSLKYYEVYLAMKYRKVDNNGEYYGGAPYYIFYGLRKKIGSKLARMLSSIFALLCVVNSLTTGNLVQINAVSYLTNLPKLSVGLVFAIVSFLIILGGIKRIGQFTSILMPILSAFYTIMSIYIIFTNMSEIPSVFALIFKEAFKIKSAVSGFCGYGIMSAIRFGISRGLLSNEAGCGTSPTAHASSNATDMHSQGCLGIFEVFIDTILLCTLTALVILLAQKNSNNAMALVVSSYEKYTFIIGKYGIIASSLLFSLATITCQYYYGAESLSYITKKNYARIIFTIVFCVVIIIGAIIPMSLMWQISDLAISLMTLFNLICLFALRNDIKN